MAVKVEVPSRFLRDLLEAIGGRGVDLARAYLRNTQGSETLQESMSFYIQKIDQAGGVGKIVVPYFWAEYVHNGRGPVRAKPGHYLVFFPDKRDDPRTDGGTSYPVTRAQARSPSWRLSASDFQRFLEINRERRAQGRNPIMIVTKSVGPAPRKRPFFTEGLRPLEAYANEVGLRMFEEYLKRSGFYKREKITATLNL